MKKYLILFLSLTSIFLTSCATSKKPIKDEWGPMAVMSVTFNETIEWFGQTAEDKQKNAGGLLGLAFRKAVDKKADDDALTFFGHTKPLIEDAKNDLFKVLEDLNIEVLNENTVIKSQEYKAEDPNKALSLAFISAAGYKPFLPKNKLAPEIHRKYGANSFAYVQINIYKVMDKGIGKNGAVTGMIVPSITIADSKGKVLANYTGYRRCFESIPVFAGLYNKEKLQDLYPEVFEYAIRDVFFN